MSHTEKTVVDSGYFDPNDGFTARPIVGSQGLPESGYDGGAPFYQVVPSGEWWGDDYEQNNADVETRGYSAPSGINYFFPTEGVGDLNEDWQSSTRFQDIRWYEQSGLIPTYPSNHPDESRDPLRSPSPKERVYAYQGSRDAAGAANKLDTGSPQSSVDGSSDQAFSNVADSTNTKYVLGMEDAFIHYYEDTYQYVYMPGGRTGPTRTLVNKFEALDFNKRFHNRNNGGEITDKADKIFGVQIAQDSLYAKSGYRKIETEEPEIDPEGDYTPTGKIRESE